MYVTMYCKRSMLHSVLFTIFTKHHSFVQLCKAGEGHLLTSHFGTVNKIMGTGSKRTVLVEPKPEFQIYDVAFRCCDLHND